ncbi:MAG: carboxypeptidase-like regulatory domain-containing protein, partial [Acidobacteriota bacterium]
MLSVLSLVVLLQTPPASQVPRPPVVGKGSIAGVVVSETGQPLKGARVTTSSGAQGRTAVTDATGTFVFEKLPEGRYSVSASRTRYLTSSYGQKRPERSGTSVQLADGEQRKGLKIVLFSAGVITGTIYNDDGEPVQSAQVRALR